MTYITVVIATSNDVLSIDVTPETTLQQLKARIEFQSAIPSSQQKIQYDGRDLLIESQTMSQLGITADGMLLVHTTPTTSNHSTGEQSTPAILAPSSTNQELAAQLRRYVEQQQVQSQRQQQQRVPRPSPQSSAKKTPSADDTERLRQLYLTNPTELSRLSDMLPDLAAAINSPSAWSQEYARLQQRQAELQRERERDLQRLQADPFDAEAQKRIEEMIRQDQVDANLDAAREHHPEAFGNVTMLYIPVLVNSHPVKAFVDSGAQSTIMSPDCAQSCGLTRLLDTRWAGIARGVGTAKILGRVHSASIKIGSSHLPCSFTVMEGKSVDLLLGLDMLKRYQACIDLGAGCLRIQGDQVPFLGEADLPKTEEVRSAEPLVDGPDGGKIGGVSGAVVLEPTASTSVPTSASTAAATSAEVVQDSTTTTTTFPEKDVLKLVEMGVDRDSAVQLLTLAEGNVDAAASLIFS